jgi:biopolymer transport protein ExbD
MKLEIKRKRPRIELVPMIDVIFFLLVFFMMFSTLKTAQTGVDVDLPKTVHTGLPQQNTVVISIDKNSRFFYGKEPFKLSELKDRVTLELAKDPATRFIINPDAVVPYHDLIQVMDLLAGAGVEHPFWGVVREQMPRAGKNS